MGDHGGEHADHQRTLRVALALNALMFVIGLVAGILGQSSGLIADALDMLADASAYAVALLAVTRGARFKASAARWSGTVLMILGAAVIGDAVRRGFVGSAPEGAIMIVVATVSLAVNATVLALLAKEQTSNEIHLRASYIFTRADVVANLGVIFSGAILLVTHFRYVDLGAAVAIGIYVMHEAGEILEGAREARGKLPDYR
jgi:cation diffusion facilitator family transporter